MSPLTHLDHISAVEVGDRRISLKDFVSRPQVRNLLRRELNAVADSELVACYAGNNALQVSVSDLQNAADICRRQSGLFSVLQTEAWLEQQQMSVCDFELMLEEELLHRAVFDHVTRNAAQYIASAPGEWDRFAIKVISVSHEELARELMTQLAEERVEFDVLASQHSQHPSARFGGRLDLVFRRSLPEQLAEPLQDSAPGDLIGPLNTDSGWVIVLVENLHAAVPDSETLQAVRNHMFDSWLKDTRKSTTIRFPVLTTE